MSGGVDNSTDGQFWKTKAVACTLGGGGGGGRYEHGSGQF